MPDPRVGIGVMVIRDGKVLLGRRQGSHGAGHYAWPGGHLEYMESFEECAKREVREETGIEIDNVRFLRLYNLKQYARSIMWISAWWLIGKAVSRKYSSPTNATAGTGTAWMNFPSRYSAV